MGRQCFNPQPEAALKLSHCLLPLLAAGFACGARAQGTPLPGLRAASESSGPEAAPKLAPTLKAAADAAAKGDFAAAADLLKKEADGGNADAAIGYADFLLHGRGLKADAAAAMEWLEKAGTPAAQFLMAQILFAGAPGVPKDEDRARFLLNAAAEAGNAGALARLGVLAEQEAHKADAASDRSRLFTEARGYYEKAAAQNQPDALYALARFTDEGLGGLEKDAQKATEGFLKAARAGSLAAANEMGVRYCAGSGIQPDRPAGLGWFLVAAEAGMPAAMANLGRCYETGDTVPRNYDQAGFWYARAAKAGFPQAQFLLGGLFEKGLGTEKNLTFAYVNYSRASAAGIPGAAEARDALKPRLSNKEITEAEKLLSRPEASVKP
jgi:TPR repeat protein